MSEENIISQPISFLSDKALPNLKRGFKWWELSDGIIGTDQETSAILENIQISIIQQEDKIPPLIHAGMTSVTALVFGQNWAKNCNGSTLPDEEFDQAVTEQYIRVLTENKPLVHEIIAPLYHPIKGNCLVSYERLLLPCRFRGGGNVIGSVTGLKSFSVLPNIPNQDDPSKPANRSD